MQTASTLPVSLILALLLGAGVVAASDSMGVTVSIPFSADGVAMGQVAFVGTASGSYKSINADTEATFGTSGFASAELNASTTVDSVDLSSEFNFSPEGFTSGSATLARTFAPFNLSATTSFSPAGFGGLTLSGATRTAEGVSLSSSTTITTDGFSQQVLTFGLAVSGMSVSRTTVVTPDGLAQERWDMGASVGDYRFSRTTIYTAQGFSRETISASTSMQGVNLSLSANFGGDGFQGGALNLSRSFAGLELIGAEPEAPEGPPSEGESEESSAE